MEPNKNFSLIGYACGAGAVTPGTEDGPAMYRKLGVKERIERCGVNVSDLGDVGPDLSLSPDPGIISAGEQQIKNLAEVYSSCRQLAAKTEEALRNGFIPITLGGDHSLAIGGIAGVSNFYKDRGEKVGVIWIDTHADINVPESSPSKKIYGMPVAVLAGQIPGALASLQRSRPAFDLTNFVYVGLHDLDPPEKALIRHLQIKAFTMKDIDINGMGKVMTQAIQIASAGTAGFVVSFDLDVCDPQLAPGTGTIKPGGLTYREAHLCLELILDSKKLLAFELVELNPRLDKDQRTAELALSLIESVLGKSIL